MSRARQHVYDAFRNRGVLPFRNLRNDFTVWTAGSERSQALPFAAEEICPPSCWFDRKMV
jgi:hypothetical protein